MLYVVLLDFLHLILKVITDYWQAEMDGSDT